MEKSVLLCRVLVPRGLRESGVEKALIALLSSGFQVPAPSLVSEISPSRKLQFVHLHIKTHARLSSVPGEGTGGIFATLRPHLSLWAGVFASVCMVLICHIPQGFMV